MFGSFAKRTARAWKWLGSAGLTLVSVLILLGQISLLRISYEFHLRDVIDASAQNGRGDEAFAETDFGRGPSHPSDTMIWLKRAGTLFSKTLLEANSYSVLVGLKWRGDDILVLQLDFGCDGHNTEPVRKVGPIQIRYHFGDPGYTPKPGYESFRRRDLPAEPCN
jgi:hypothetical protein